MRSEERIHLIWGVVAVIVALAITSMIVLTVKINGDRLRPAQRRQYERQIEAVRTCAHATEVTTCIRVAQGGQQ